VPDKREPLRKTFDSAAGLYGRARPAYPDELIDDLVALAQLGRGARLLEIGCGTGIATRPLLERGFEVRCLALLDTFSGHIAMEARKREHLYAEIRRRISLRPDPRIRRHWLAILHTARRKAEA
jgi:SAM-dependent methyltransferase